jgi:hypothetical protein
MRTRRIWKINMFFRFANMQVPIHATLSATDRDMTLMKDECFREI